MCRGLQSNAQRLHAHAHAHAHGHVTCTCTCTCILQAVTKGAAAAARQAARTGTATAQGAAPVKVSARQAAKDKFDWSGLGQEATLASAAGAAHTMARREGRLDAEEAAVAAGALPPNAPAGHGPYPHPEPYPEPYP